MSSNHFLSIILPAYNEQDNILYAFDVISNILSSASIPFELIFIDDGSGDMTYQIGRASCRERV